MSSIRKKVIKMDEAIDGAALEVLRELEPTSVDCVALPPLIENSEHKRIS